MNRFEKDLYDLETAFYLQLLPPVTVAERRQTMLSLIIEYTPLSKSISIIFHAGSRLVKNESFFLVKRDGYRKMSEHAAALLQKYLPNSQCYDNIVKIPVHFETLHKFVKFFEKDIDNWQIEWITKWELKRVFENHHDLLLNIESKSFTDLEIATFFNTFEKKLKQYYTIF